MSFKGFVKKFTACLLALMIVLFNTSVGAAEKTARLRSCLETVHMYQVFPIDFITSMAAESPSRFKDNYDDRYMAFTGQVRFGSVSDNHKSVKVYGPNHYIEVDTSEQQVKNIAGLLKPGDYVTVYGQVDGKEVDAEYLYINPNFEIPSLKYVFYPDMIIDGETITDLAADGHVLFSLPEDWKNDYVMGRLTNNGVNGYQFFLNAISPQNLNYPENFYIFYFNYETYLNPVKKSPDKYDIWDNESIVIKNILSTLSGDSKPSMQRFDLQDGTYVDYYTTVYKPADGNDYRLEFMFKPDSTGLVCMLYLYYPNDGAVSHLREVSYLINSIKN
ncbi:MAG: hypothetical protein IKO54_00055 [Lachnospiraceae bacterium]|nr:hypothetical protein [Lachnospiraceae bacterium]MBR4540550.1 hypothetical protein [Lachnospiraceae bacterium]